MKPGQPWPASLQVGLFLALVCPAVCCGVGTFLAAVIAVPVFVLPATACFLLGVAVLFFGGLQHAGPPDDD